MSKKELVLSAEERKAVLALRAKKKREEEKLLAEKEQEASIKAKFNEVLSRYPTFVEFIRMFGNYKKSDCSHSQTHRYVDVFVNEYKANETFEPITVFASSRTVTRCGARKLCKCDADVYSLKLTSFRKISFSNDKSVPKITFDVIDGHVVDAFCYYGPHSFSFSQLDGFDRYFYEPPFYLPVDTSVLDRFFEFFVKIIKRNLSSSKGKLDAVYSEYIKLKNEFKVLIATYSKVPELADYFTELGVLKKKGGE